DVFVRLRTCRGAPHLTPGPKPGGASSAPSGFCVAAMLGSALRSRKEPPMASTTVTPPRHAWQFGRIYAPDEPWLATPPPEQIPDPELPIVAPHHHLWQRGDHRYLLDELLADLGTGHNIVATVFEECRSMYRAHGPAELRPIGETEFVAGIAAMSASGNY